MSINKDKEEELLESLGQQIGKEKTELLSKAMKELRDEFFALADKENMSEEGKLVLKNLAMKQFTLGFDASRIWFEAKGLI